MGQGLYKQLGTVTKMVDRMTGNAEERPKEKEKKEAELRKIINKALEKRFPKFDEQIKDWSVNQFCQAVYEILEEICEMNGGIQFKLPTVDDLRKTFDKAHVDKKKPLDKMEFQKIIAEVIKIDSFYVGQRGKDVFLYIFGVPVVALFVKRMIPGPTAAIADDVFLPAVTSGTAYYLAKTNRL